MINKPLEKHGIETNIFLAYFLLLPLLLIFFFFLLVLLPNAAFAKDIARDDFAGGSVTTAIPESVPVPVSVSEPISELVPIPGSGSELEPKPGAGVTVVNNKSLDVIDANDSNNSHENNLNKDLERTPQGTSQSVNKNNNKHSTRGVTVGAAAKTVAPIKENHDVNETNDISDLEHKAETTEKVEKTQESKENIKSSTVISHKQNTAKTSSNSSSVKEIPFADNEQINVFLSNRDINRILVKGDKIQGINGPTGLYTAKNDATGSAYISLYGDITFTIFASTLKGHNFSLLVTPRSIPGKTIILEPTTPSFLTGRVEEEDSYQKTLIALISNMINAEPSEDYAYLSASQAKGNKKTNFYDIAYIKPIAFYSGTHLLGITSEIKNRTRKPIVLKPSYFYRSGVRAVALSQETIAPFATGLLYQVVSQN